MESGSENIARRFNRNLNRKWVRLKQSVEDLIVEIRSFLEENRLVEYPQALNLDFDSIAHVEWDDENWQAFLKLAPAVGSKVVYVGTFEFSAEMDDTTGGEDEGESSEKKGIPTINDLRYDEDDDDAVVRLFGRDHDGEVSSLRLAYVAGGVAHSWMTFAPWYEEALSTVVELRERRELVGGTVLSNLNELRDRSIQEDWAATVAHDRRFFTAQAIPSVRQQATLEILTEITGIDSSDPLLVGVSWSTSSSARTLLPEVKSELEDEAIGHLPELASELVGRHPEWATLRVALREKYARSYLIEEIGMSLPMVAGELARYRK